MPDKNSERHVMDILTEDLKEKEGLNFKHRKELDPPDPDFLIKVKEDTIGVEVTRFSVQGDQFEANRLIDIALEHGRKEFRDSGGPALYVSVHFSREPETKRQAESIGKGLAHVVQIMLEHKIKYSNYYSHDALFALFSEYGILDNVSNISFLWSADGKAELWQSPRSGWEASVTAKDIQKIIEGKNEKLSDYRKNCKSVWLTIYNCLEAGFYAISDEATQFRYKHDFDRIFWIEMGGGNSISLSDPILPAIRESRPKSRTDVFRVYELRIEGKN